MPWIVVKTKGQRELYASEHVERQGFEAYLPRYETRRGRGRMYTLLVPLFPSYLFVDIDGKPWRPLLSTYGVLSVIMNGEKPAIMPDTAITLLKEQEKEDGIVVLPPLKEGDKLRITSGVLADKFGIYAGQATGQRVKIMLDVLGGKRTITISNKSVEKV